MRTIAYTLLFYLISTSLLSKQNFAYNQNLTDTLVKILNYPQNDSARAIELNKISYLLKNTNPIIVFENLKKYKSFVELVDFSKEMAFIYGDHGNYNKAITYSQIGLLYADSLSSPLAKKELLHNLHNFYNASGNEAMALVSYKNYIEINDSLKQVVFTDSIAEIKQIFENKKGAESILYKKDIDLLDQKNKDQNNLLNYLYLFVVALLLLIFYFIYSYYKLQKKQKQEVAEGIILMNDEKQKIVYFEKKLKETDHLLEDLKLKMEKQLREINDEKIVISKIKKPEDSDFYSLNESLLNKVGVTDMANLILFSANDKLIICNYLKLFLDRIPVLSEQIEKDLAANNLEAIRNTTHAIKNILFEILSSKYQSLVINVTRSIETDEKLRPTMILDFVKICNMAVIEVSRILE